MPILVDENMPMSVTSHLCELGIEARHTSSLGLNGATDPELLAYATEHGWVIVTQDSDFHETIAREGWHHPTVIRVRDVPLKKIADAIVRVWAEYEADISAGALLSLGEGGVRSRRLPVTR